MGRINTTTKEPAGLHHLMPRVMNRGSGVVNTSDKGELISKTVEDVAQTKAEATEHVVFMVVVGVVLSVALIAAALYFRGRQGNDP